MKIVLKPVLLALMCAGMVACKSKEPEPEPTPAPEPTQPAPEPAQPAPVDPRDYSDPRNIDNPRSLLSKRVVYFDFDKANIKDEFRAILDAHGTFLSSNPNARITLEGHADERGTREYNLGLGERRGNSVSDFLDATGGAGAQLSVVSYGEERPVANCSDDSCWSQNRRVEIVYTRVQ